MIEAAPLEYRTRILQAVNSLLVLEVISIKIEVEGRMCFHFNSFFFMLIRE